MHDSGSIVRPNAHEDIHLRVVDHGIAYVFSCQSPVRVVSHVVELLKSISCPITKTVHSLHGVLSARCSYARDIGAAVGTEAFGTTSQFLSTGIVIGAQIGETGIAHFFPVDIRIKGENRNPILAELAHQLGHSLIPS